MQRSGLPTPRKGLVTQARRGFSAPSPDGDPRAPSCAPGSVLSRSWPRMTSIYGWEAPSDSKRNIFFAWVGKFPKEKTGTRSAVYGKVAAPPSGQRTPSGHLASLVPSSWWSRRASRARGAPARPARPVMAFHALLVAERTRLRREEADLLNPPLFPCYDHSLPTNPNPTAMATQARPSRTATPPYCTPAQRAPSRLRRPKSPSCPIMCASALDALAPYEKHQESFDAHHLARRGQLARECSPQVTHHPGRQVAGNSRRFQCFALCRGALPPNQALLLPIARASDHATHTENIRIDTQFWNRAARPGSAS